MTLTPDRSPWMTSFEWTARDVNTLAIQGMRVTHDKLNQRRLLESKCDTVNRRGCLNKTSLTYDLQAPLMAEAGSLKAQVLRQAPLRHPRTHHRYIRPEASDDAKQRKNVHVLESLPDNDLPPQPLIEVEPITNS